ncbi:lysophospholipid acyltransferase family protein [Brucella sp. IR073]|uniref:lysophospholipid acyltransferase family protein n=1 Tax=unclassified Brucella TaxID=2632610 RepID=UPI003B983F50
MVENIDQRPRNTGAAKRIWRSIRGPLARSAGVRSALVWLISAYLKFVHATNPRLPGSKDPYELERDYHPLIVTCWHGQHLMAPFLRPKHMPLVAMFSRSADAELNARVGERLGLETVRGSGGRGTRTRMDKGGARALLALKNALRDGKSTAIIADIAHGKAREAGQGVILLGKLSGRPILPIGYAFSRRKVLEKSWDKTVIPLPFGRSVVVSCEPVVVPMDADDAMLEEKRKELTDKLNAVTAEAYARLEQAR